MEAQKENTRTWHYVLQLICTGEVRKPSPRALTFSNRLRTASRPWRLQDGITLRTAHRDLVSFAVLRLALHELRRDECVVALIPDGLLLSVVAPTTKPAIVCYHHTVRLAHSGISDHVRHHLYARSADHVHNTGLWLWATARPKLACGATLSILAPWVLREVGDRWPLCPYTA